MIDYLDLGGGLAFWKVTSAVFVSGQSTNSALIRRQLVTASNNERG